ncbi:MAG TPA: class IV adenylate cyclase [Thermoanaerobaculia bacterium]|nr:class IV adenylate cyclase [Thermoanaerobaculia bacterium]
MTSAADPAKPRREEVEVKLPCEDPEAVRGKLRDLGASLKSVLHFESNELYDDAEGRLRSAGQALRLRREGEAGGPGILTYKGAARFEGGIKTREERETRVTDPEEAEAILRALGFVRRFRYEKRREEWTLEECAVALDETPIGNFVEVEGSPVAIRRCVAALELDFSRAIPYTYARLYADRRKEDPTLPGDMIFTRPG